MADSIFQVVDSLSIGGAERMAVDVSNGLVARGRDVHLFATRALGPLASEVDDRVVLQNLARRSRWDLHGLRRFRSAVDRARPAVVHAHGWSSLAFATAGLLGHRRPPALVFHDHLGRRDVPPAQRSVGHVDGLGPVHRAYRIGAWLLTNGHLAVDRSLLEPRLRTRRRLVEAVVANGVPVESFTTKHDHLVAGRPRLVCVANLRPPKDHPCLFGAVADLAERGITVEVDLIGSEGDRAYVRACRRDVESLGLEGQVQMLGARSGIASILATYDIGILSSHTESGPIALIEYLAAGLPFVVTDVGEIPAMLPDELRRWVVVPGDPAALAAKVAELLDLPAEERASQAELGVTFVRDHLSIDSTIDAIERVYDELAVR